MPNISEVLTFVSNYKTMAIKQSTFTFLKDLARNNDKEWFAEHKPRYQEAHADAKALVSAVEEELSKTDELEKSKLFRIYRDVRFSKDKTPYKESFSMSFARATAYRRGGYYLFIKPGGQSMAGGGFYNPEPADLKLIRAQIAADSQPLRKIIASKSFVEMFGTLQGEQVKTAPKGYTKDHPDIDLLRFKSFYVMRQFTDKEVLSNDFVNLIGDTYRNIRPYFDYMSDILTHDTNGISLLDR